MLTNRRIKPLFLLGNALRIVSAAAIWAMLVFAGYAYLDLDWLRVPFLPISTIGTAVAFYVGFKNNSSYDRFWEGRKIWGGVVNTSRTWGTTVMSYVQPDDDSEEAAAVRRRLMYRHLAWINALRLQLRKTSRFYEKPARRTKRRLKRHADAMRNNWDQEISSWLSENEHEEFKACKNPATHMLMRQGTELRDLKATGRVDLFHQIAMMDLVEEMYALQGKCERIKNTPYPRMYAEMSRIFTRVFVVLVPFGMLDVFAEHIRNASAGAETAAWLAPMVFSSALVTWVFTSMEAGGDATEDPFERSVSDVPMNALCRTIEIDLREMLGETSLPEKEPAHDGILY